MRSKVSSLPGNIATAAPLSASTCSHPCSSVMSLSCAMVAKVSSTRKRSRRIILFSCSIFDARSSSAMSAYSVWGGREAPLYHRSDWRSWANAAGLSRSREDANLFCAVSPVRLKSSFIYLANAVNDLRGNWSVLAIVLAPLLLTASLCLLPDALNLQHRLAANFEPGSQNISYTQRETADTPSTPAPAPTPAPLQEPQPYSPWFINALHLIFGLLTLLVTLITLSALKRI